MERSERLKNRRDLIRRTAQLLAAPLPLHETLEQFSKLLSSFVDASYAGVAVRDQNQASLEYVFEIGTGARLETQTQRVFETGEPSLTKSAIVVPIPFGARTVGVLGVRSQPPNIYDEDDLLMLENCAIYLGARMHDEQERAQREWLEEAASTDALTGLANRRTFDETLQREWHRCARSRSPLSVLMCDVDFFKAFNDAYGHLAGDGCLRQVARAIAGSVKRPFDLTARYGGEEFAIILPETTAGDAFGVGESICEAVRTLQVPHQGSSLEYVTVSVGCASVVPEGTADPQSLTSAADEQLYRAKELGRNRLACGTHASDAPAAQQRAMLRHNLVSIHSSFLGRESDIAAIGERLDAGHFVTVTGPGGIGKTRLAIEFGHRRLERYPDGVWFVDFATLSDEAFVVPAILATLSLREEPGRDAADTLVAHLREKRALLVFDNCEHVVQQAARIGDQLLHECRHLHVVATSRELLGIAGESVHRIATLDDDEGAALFASRAASVFPSIALTPADMETVGRICRRLDGIPLAIELAAARVRIMSVDELWKRLDDRFRILSGGSRTALPRHQTLRGLIDWSYNLLPEEERIVLRRLAVFNGRFGLDAVTEVCAVDPIGEERVLDVLAHLIDKSLLMRDPVDARYWLLESTKEFALDRLSESGEAGAMRRRHAERMLMHAESVKTARRRLDDWLAQIERDYAEHRAALQWAVSDGVDLDVGARLAASLNAFWYDTGRPREATFWLERVLARETELASEQRAKILMALSNHAFLEGDYERMASIARRAEAVCAQAGDVRGQAVAWNDLAIAAKNAGEIDEAYALWQRALGASRQIGNRYGEAVQLLNLAELLSDWKCEFAQAEALFDESLAITRAIETTFFVPVVLSDWSQAAAYRGDFDRADALAGEAAALFGELGDDMRIAEALIRRGHYRAWANDSESAQTLLGQAIEHLSESLNPKLLARCAEAAAAAAAASDRLTDAARLLAFSDEWRAAKHLPRPRAMQERCDALTASLNERCDRDALAQYRALGRSLGADAALDLCRP